VYALLLDALGIDRAAVFGYSGGGPAAIQFALRRTGRTTVLILMASALPGKAGAPPKALAQAFFRSERLLWILKSYAPSLFARILGMPKGFHPTPRKSAIPYQIRRLAVAGVPPPAAAPVPPVGSEPVSAIVMSPCSSS
jgi:pimeloyl-ACP methyl ester carboxylesterase